MASEVQGKTQQRLHIRTSIDPLIFKLSQKYCLGFSYFTLREETALE